MSCGNSKSLENYVVSLQKVHLIHTSLTFSHFDRIERTLANASVFSVFVNSGASSRA